MNAEYLERGHLQQICYEILLRGLFLPSGRHDIWKSNNMCTQM